MCELRVMRDEVKNYMTFACRLRVNGGNGERAGVAAVAMISTSWTDSCGISINSRHRDPHAIVRRSRLGRCRGRNRRDDDGSRCSSSSAGASYASAPL
jgi:hypothetical protein